MKTATHAALIHAPDLRGLVFVRRDGSRCCSALEGEITDAAHAASQIAAHKESLPAPCPHGNMVPNAVPPDNLLIQTDGQWWACWTPIGDAHPFEDSYTTADDLSDVDAGVPRQSVLIDLFERLNDGKPFPFHVIDRGVKIGSDGWPEPSPSAPGNGDRS